MIAFPLRRATNIAWQPLTIGRTERATQKQQKPCIVWFTGLSGAGKSTIANILDQKLFALGRHTMLLDGDNVRHGLNRDLGFTEADRVENIRRAGEVAKLMVDSGLIVICSFISPYRAEREMVRALVGDGEFIEVFVDTPIEECVRRDPKGLYSKAKAGKIKNFTGIDAPLRGPRTTRDPARHRRPAARTARRRDHRAVGSLSLRVGVSTGARQRRVLAFDKLDSSDEASRKSAPLRCSLTRSVIGDKMSRATVASSWSATRRARSRPARSRYNPACCR